MLSIAVEAELLARQRKPVNQISPPVKKRRISLKAAYRVFLDNSQRGSLIFQF